MNGVVHFEIPADDMARAKKFYQDVFGWQLTDYGTPGQYAMAVTTPTGETGPSAPGAINGAITARDDTSKATVVVMNVDSIEEAMKKVVAAGGKEVMAKQQVADMGYYAKALDTEGNIIGLWESKEKTS